VNIARKRVTIKRSAGVSILTFGQRGQGEANLTRGVISDGGREETMEERGYAVRSEEVESTQKQQSEPNTSQLDPMWQLT
jgi:hypothetical protein